jgi:hypothetical protein
LSQGLHHAVRRLQCELSTSSWQLKLHWFARLHVHVSCLLVQDANLCAAPCSACLLGHPVVHVAALCLQEVGDLRQALSREVDELRSEFGDLKAALKQQIEVMNSVQAATAAASGNNSVSAAH